MSYTISLCCGSCPCATGPARRKSTRYSFSEALSLAERGSFAITGLYRLVSEIECRVLEQAQGDNRFRASVAFLTQRIRFAPRQWIRLTLLPGGREICNARMIEQHCINERGDLDKVRRPITFGR
jgi:hypothetical protein